MKEKYKLRIREGFSYFTILDFVYNPDDSNNVRIKGISPIRGLFFNARNTDVYNRLSNIKLYYKKIDK